MKKHFLLGAILGVGIGAAVSTIIANKQKEKHDDSETSCCGCGGNCKCHEKKDEEPTILYNDDDGKILKSPLSILEDYVGKPMPNPKKLTLYFAATSKDDAAEMCKNRNTFKLSTCNGGLVCDTTSKPSFYVGVCLPVKELFLWAMANEKVIYVKPVGEMYVKGSDCNEKWYVDLEIIEE